MYLADNNDEIIDHKKLDCSGNEQMGQSYRKFVLNLDLD